MLKREWSSVAVSSQRLTFMSCPLSTINGAKESITSSPIARSDLKLKEGQWFSQKELLLYQRKPALSHYGAS